MPGNLDETLVIAKFISDREFHWNNDQGWSIGFKPELTVIAFKNHRKADTTGGEDLPEIEAPPEPEPPTPPGGEPKIEIKINYDGYKAYLKSNYRGGGFYYSEEEEREIDGLDVSCYEIKVEKGTSFSGPKRLVTWVYHTADFDIAVQFEVLENSYDKLRSTILRTLKSFKTIERTGEAEEGLGERSLSFYDTEDWSPEEREELRRLLEEKSHQDAIDSLPDDWDHKKFGNILVLAHDNMKYGKTLVGQVKAVMGWLDKEFYFVGPDEYVRSPILRICKDQDEEFSFRRASETWSGLGTEIVTHKDNWNFGGQSFEFRWVNGRIMDIWFQDRDKDLYWALPTWLRTGLRTTIGGGVAKGSRLNFEATTWETQELRDLERGAGLRSPRDLMVMGSQDLFSTRYGNDEVSALVRFLVERKGPKKAKDALAKYIANIKAITEEARRDDNKDKPSDDKPKTEEEEEEYFKKRRNAWKEKERMVLDTAFDRTFGDWTEKDWRAFEAAYFRSID